MIIINFTEEELKSYLASHPSFVFDEEKNIVRKKTKAELEIEKKEGKMQEKASKKKNCGHSMSAIKNERKAPIKASSE